MPGGFSDIAALVAYLTVAGFVALALWLVGTPAWLAFLGAPGFAVWLWLRAVRD